MKREILSFSAVRRLRTSPLFVFLASALLCGVLAGSLTGMRIPGAEGSYAQELAALLGENAAGKLPTARTVALCLAGTFGWPLAMLLAGRLPGRRLWAALLAAVRGFLLSFAAAAALTESGLWGVYLSFVSIGISAALWLPALLLLGTACLEAGAEHGGYFRALGRYGAALAVCILLFLLSALWRMLAVPVLL